MSEKYLSTYVSLRERLILFLSDDKGGERDTLTTLLLLALIVIPLAIVIIGFGDEIGQKAQEKWDEVFGD